MLYIKQYIIYCIYHRLTLLKISIKIYFTTIDCSVCDQHAACSIKNGKSECSCPTGYWGNGYACNCDLFAFHCDIDMGFSVTVNYTCLYERYPYLPEEYSMFVTAYNYTEHPEAIPSLDNITTACVFQG